MRRASIATLVIWLSGLATACGVGHPAAEATCAPTASLDGRLYRSQIAVVQPIPGETVGVITIPGCNDDNGHQTPDGHQTVAELPGVDVKQAVVDAEEPVVIYLSVDLVSIPPEIDRYFVAPTCDSRDSPILLHGPWLSIPGTNANVDPDPVPPYQVEVLVTDSTSDAYLNAELIIAVPRSLGMPITHADVEESLWGGGSLRVTATCREDNFVAASIDVIPP